MRLIADENISWRIKRLLPQWEVMPSNEIKLDKKLTDFNIWQFAKSNSYTILTFDEDFSELQNIFSYPPKIIWLRTGNLGTSAIVTLLIKYQNDIESFIINDNLGVFEIYL